MKLLPRQIFHIPILLGITLLFALFVCVPQPVLAQFYYEDAYYMLEEGYCAYESNVQDAFAAQNPTASSPSQIRGRQNLWEDEYQDEKLHPGDPLPLGDHTILFVLAAITAMVIFYKQRKRKQPSSSVQTLLTTLVFIFVASPLFALTNGDLRLQYIEQELKKDGKKTIINRLYHFESHTFTLEEGKCDTISVHIFNMIKGGKDHVNHPEIVLQEYDGSKWVDKEAHMVFGPLRDDAGVGLLPGRKNAGETSDSPVDDWVIQDGIENIKNDQTYADKGFRASGVWNFVVTKQGGKATFDMTQVHRHEGNFYVRVNGDPNYLNDTNLVTFSEYAYKHIYEDPIGALKPHDYTHYDCKFLPANSNITFTIATEHSPRIADELMVNNQRYKSNPTITDQYVTSDGGRPILPAAANIRFSWDIMTNRLTRAYIGDTKTAAGEYLVVHNEVQPTTFKYFQDNTNWMYSVDINAIRENKAVIRAKFKGQDQILWGTALTSGASFVGGTDTDLSRTYPLRLIYDFKDHRLVTIYNPNSEIAGEVNLQTPVMIHREHNNSATQLTFPSNTDKVVTTGDNTDDKYTNPAYAVLTFLEDKFATNAATSHYEKMFYWVSFPFNVNLKDVFGLGAYGDYWAVQYYNGERRAREGLPTEESTGWDYVAETKEEAASKVLKANTGYVVCLNYKRLSKDYQYTSGGGRKVSLYFPSANRVSPAEIKQQSDVITVDLAEYTNTTTGSNTTWNHHNWHLLGVPSYANPDFRTTQGDVPFFYQYWHPTDGYAAVASTEVDFYAMHAYMVQYAGEIEWSKIVNTDAPSGLAAKKNSSAIDKTMLRLELQQAGETVDKTYVQLRDEEGTEGFDLNLDLTKIINKGANIYTVVNGDQMAGNVVPAQESMIPLGVVITEAGEYTLTLPSRTNGVTVELVDYETGTSTNLLALDYTVRLTAGTHEGRFALRIQPSKVTTDLENIDGETTGDKASVRKYIIDGALYLVKDGMLYDAQGRLVR